MKICLINPPQILSRHYGMPYIFQPIGLLYIAAVLEKEYAVEVIDASLEGASSLKQIRGQYYLGLSYDEIEQRIRLANPDIVGISVPFSINEACALNIASTVKSIGKNIAVILGGAHPSARPLETLSCEYVDFVVAGEGEETARELIRNISNGQYDRLKDIAGIGYKENGNPVLTSPRALIQDLDTIPFPARHLVNMEKYFKAMELKRGARQMYTFDKRWTSIITSRGCSYSCNFCSIHLTMGREFRARSPENIVSEIKEVTQDYNIRHINFEDDNLTLDKKRASLFFDLLTRESDITWSMPNGIRCDCLDEELVKKMKVSGCKRVFVAPESGVQRVVTEIIGKRMDLKDIEKAVAIFRKYGIIVDGSFVIGSIGETKKDIIKTIRYILRLKRLGMEAAGLHLATPYYGTKLYEEARQKGFLKEGFNAGRLTTTEPSIHTPEWSINEILWLRRIAVILIVIYDLKKKILNAWSNYFSKASYPVTLAKNYYRIILSKVTGKLPKLEFLVYEVTDACNSCCRHCYIWRRKPTEDILSVEEVKKILSDVFFSNLKTVLLTGGEPALRDDIKEIISAIHAVKPQADITLSTNALLPERIIDIAKYSVINNIRINIGVSVDAVGEAHDSIRGVAGNFEKADYLIRELLRLKEKYGDSMGGIVLGYTLSNLTVDTLKDVAKYAKTLKLNYITQLYEEFIYYNNINQNKNSDNAKDYYRTHNVSLIDSVKKLPPSLHSEVLINALRHKLRFKCASVQTFFLLKCNGDVTPCLRYSNCCIGNLREQSISHIWNGAPAERARSIVAECWGCSNSWATSWSLRFWPFSFWRIVIALMAKRIIYRTKNR